MSRRFFIALERGDPLQEFDQLWADWHGPPLETLKDAGGLTLAIWAARFDRADVIEWMFEKAVPLGEPDQHGMTPLHHAADGGCVNAAGALIGKPGVDVDAVDHRGVAAVHLAASRKDGAMVQRLGDGGANLSIQTPELLSPAHIAACEGDDHVIKVLAAAKAQLGLKNEWKQTPAYLAAHEGHDEAFRRLANAGVDLTVPDADGLTSLHVAAIQGFPAILEVLKFDGYNLNAPDREGITAAHWAAAHRREEVLRYLLAQELPLPRTPAEWPAAWAPSAVTSYQQCIDQLVMERAMSEMAGLEPATGDPTLVQNRLVELRCPITFDPFTRYGPGRPLKLPDVHGVPGSVISAAALQGLLDTPPPHRDHGDLPPRDPLNNSVLDRGECQLLLSTDAVDRERQSRVEAVLGVYLSGDRATGRAARAFAAAAPQTADGIPRHFSDVVWVREPGRGRAAAASHAALPRGPSSGAGPAI